MQIECYQMIRLSSTPGQASANVPRRDMPRQPATFQEATSTTQPVLQGRASICSHGRISVSL